MGFERSRLLAAALVLVGAGALAHASGASARAWTGAGALALAGLGFAWPLARRQLPAPAIAEAPPAPDARQFAVLQAQVEALPVAAWLVDGETLRALTNRARRLAAPGGVRDAASLQRLLRDAEPGGPVVLETERGSERWQLRRQTLALDGRAQALLVLVPLESELEAESLLAWRQLVQVLTHEIMNSLTPIRSLSQTALALSEEPGAEADLRSALDAIARRAESLAGFVGTYRRVSQWPAPVLAPVDVRSLFARLEQAVAPDWAARGGAVSFELDAPTLRLQADEGQLEQHAARAGQQRRARHRRHAAAAPVGAGAPEPRGSPPDRRPRQRPRRAARPRAADLPAVLQRPRGRPGHRPDGGAPAGQRHGRTRAPRAAARGRRGVRAELLKDR